MKKFIALICAMLCMLSMVACSNTESDTVSAEDTATMEVQVQEIVESLFSNIASLSDEELDQLINAKNSEIAEDADMALTLKRGFASWRDAQEDLGALVSIDAFEMTQDQDSVTGTLSMTFEQRKADFVVVFDEDVTTYEAIKVEPEYTVGENLTRAALNTVLGMGIVFIVLIFIAFIISLFKYISKVEYWFAHRNDKKDASEEVFVPKSADNAPVVIDSTDDMVDDLELVAVITAAIAASMNTSVDNLVVRSIRKRNNKR